MKSIKILFLILIFTFDLYSQEAQELMDFLDGKKFISLDDPEGLIFTRNHFLYSSFYDGNIESDYEIVMKDNLPYISFTSNDGRNIEWLVLVSSNFIILLADEYNIFFEGSSNKSLEKRTAYNYSATSELIEKNKVYSANNLGRSIASLPWVESVEGSGIGECININWPVWKDGGIGSLIIGDGYISYNKPYLFLKNNRVKTIKISSPDFEDFTFVLLDSPHPQEIILPYPVENMKIEIIDVYPGTKWDDTCLNFIYGVGISEDESYRDNDDLK